MRKFVYLVLSIAIALPFINVSASNGANVPPTFVWDIQTINRYIPDSVTNKYRGWQRITVGGIYDDCYFTSLVRKDSLYGILAFYGSVDSGRHIEYSFHLQKEMSGCPDSVAAELVLHPIEWAFDSLALLARDMNLVSSSDSSMNSDKIYLNVFDQNDSLTFYSHLGCLYEGPDSAQFNFNLNLLQYLLLLPHAGK